MSDRRNPVPTVDVIIEREGGMVVLIKRRNPPSGWALPGGFVDYGETLEAAALREAREETGLDIENMRQFHAYSDPSRDLRQHTISMVFAGRSTGKLLAGDDAADAAEFDRESLPDEIAFDHRSILDDYFTGKY
ncbi:MAG: NUDIX hydrolase [Nitrospirae bacterium]|nr:NUDIX hydrolase [Nitrospirota bacterium]